MTQQYRFSEAVISLCVAVVHQQLQAVTSSTNQPLRLLNVGRTELIQFTGLHVLEHDAVALQLQLAWILHHNNDEQNLYTTITRAPIVAIWTDQSQPRPLLVVLSVFV